MTLDELKKVLAELGDDAEVKAKEIYEKMQSEKEGLETETRREVRKAWACIAVVTFLIGLGVGHFFL